MKIMHVILDSAVKKNLVHVMNLTNAVSPFAENYLITNKHVNVPNAEVLQIYKSSWNIFSMRNTFLKKLYALMPDIVHVHGCWNYATYQCMKMAQNRGFVAFFTPYEELSMREIKTRFWQEKLWKLLWYQRPMLKSANCVIVQTKKEGDVLYTLGRNKEMELVPTSESTTDKFAQQMMDLYNSAFYEQKTKEVSVQTLNAIRTQLHELLHSHSLPTIQLSSREKQQYELFCTQQELSATIHDQYEVPRYNDGDACGEIYKMVKRIKVGIGKKNATFNDVFQLAATIQNNDYDEDKLMQGLQKEGLSNFLRRLIQIADELCGIEPGFMPCLPLNDAKTIEMKQKLFSR